MKNRKLVEKIFWILFISSVIAFVILIVLSDSMNVGAKMAIPYPPPFDYREYLLLILK